MNLSEPTVSDWHQCDRVVFSCLCGMAIAVVIIVSQFAASRIRQPMQCRACHTSQSAELRQKVRAEQDLNSYRAELDAEAPARGKLSAKQNVRIVGRRTLNRRTGSCISDENCAKRAR